MSTLQRRITDRHEIRVDSKSGNKISGYAMVFYRADVPGTEYRVGDRFVERMMPGCLPEELIRGDVIATFNHNDDLPLGRTSAGTLLLEIDDIGLRYEIDPPESRADVVESIARKDVPGSSFQFSIEDENKIEDRGAGKIIYEVRKIGELAELGPVMRPAYKATSTALRSDPRFQVEFTIHKPENVEETLRMRELAMRG